MLASKKLITHQFSSLRATYATKRVCDFKSVASKKFAPDKTGTHKVQINTLCKDKDCAKKTCKMPCDEIQEAEITGNYTHSPKIKGQPNLKIVKLKNTDINGNAKPQYFAKVPKRITLTKQDLEDLTDADISTDKKGSDFFNGDTSIIKEIT